MRLVENHEGTGLRTLIERYKGRTEHFDLREHFDITGEGREYLQVRSELDALVNAPGVT
jgi:hypothetical protein